VIAYKDRTQVPALHTTHCSIALCIDSKGPG
jgi:hypothetical protein